MDRENLIDSNAIIDLFLGRLPTSGREYLEADLNQRVYYLSVVNKIELLGFETDDTVQMDFISEIVRAGVVLQLTDEITDATITLRKVHRIKLPDAIIAATALVHDLTLVSHNQKDFTKIEKLKLVDPYELRQYRLGQLPQ